MLGAWTGEEGGAVQSPGSRRGRGQPGTPDAGSAKLGVGGAMHGTRGRTEMQSLRRPQTALRCCSPAGGRSNFGGAPSPPGSDLAVTRALWRQTQRRASPALASRGCEPPAPAPA